MVCYCYNWDKNEALAELKSRNQMLEAFKSAECKGKELVDVYEGDGP